MATKKPTKTRRAPARAAKRARPRATATGGTAKRGKSGARATAGTAARGRATPRPTRAVTGGVAASRELAALKARFQRERGELERRLTATVQEIGQLRHYEARAIQLERALKERDETIGQLRSQLSELRNRPLERADDRERQPELALGAGARRDLDDLDDDLGLDDEDDDLI